MNSSRQRHHPVKSAMVRAVTFFAVIILATGVIVLMAPRSAQATRQLARQTGLPCEQCHEVPNGGGQLNDFGKSWRRRPLGTGDCYHCWPRRR
jgi:hypothetical protein